MLTNLKLTLTTDRKLVSVECDDFRVRLNGNTNDAYKRLLKEFGIEVVFSTRDSAGDTDVKDKPQPYVGVAAALGNIKEIVDPSY